MDIFDEDILSVYEKYDASGNGLWLLESVRRCMQYGRPVPDLLRHDFEAALERYRAAEARTLDDAFHVSRPKSWSQTKARKLLQKDAVGLSLAHRVYAEIMKRHAAKEPIDEGMFEVVGEMFGMKPSACRDCYREAKAVIKAGQ